MTHSDRRRALLGGGLAVVAAGTTMGVTARAEAAPGTTAWRLGGNLGVSADGSNYLGPQNVAPLLFKTAPSEGAPVERMRILATGQVGIGTPSPQAQLDVSIRRGVALRARTAGTSADNVAVFGTTSRGIGVRGQGGTGVQGEGTSIGVVGQADVDYGVYGSGGIAGVFGTGSDYGLYGSCIGGAGVYGTDNGTTGAGVAGQVYGPSASGVLGTNDGGGAGVTGRGARGVVGRAQTTIDAQGVRGEDGAGGSSATAYAAVFVGRTQVVGTLSESAGSFLIDHPLDPANRTLSHSFVESPDMKNVYDGVVTLGADGTASVVLPSYFEALNREFRYQLTCVGAHAPVYVSHEVSDNRFRIAGGPAGLKVCWQVTGTRHDAYAEQFRIAVEQDKPARDRGTYLNPAAFGKDADQAPAHLQDTPVPSLAPLRPDRNGLSGPF